MKANRKFIEEEEAVSPVIAVILMVAITVVLAATVFVLVNDLGKNVGSTGPSLGMVSDSATSSTSKWTVKLSSATQLADLSDYRFVLTTPSHGTIVATPETSTFTTMYEMYAQQATLDATRKTASASHTDAEAQLGYFFGWTDVDGNSKWSVGDTLTIVYDSDTADESAETPATFVQGNNHYDNTFAAGSYSLEVLHTPSGSSAGSLPRTF